MYVVKEIRKHSDWTGVNIRAGFRTIEQGQAFIARISARDGIAPEVFVIEYDAARIHHNEFTK